MQEVQEVQKVQEVKKTEGGRPEKTEEEIRNQKIRSHTPPQKLRIAREGAALRHTRPMLRLLRMTKAV